MDDDATFLESFEIDPALVTTRKIRDHLVATHKERGQFTTGSTVSGLLAAVQELEERLVVLESRH